MKKEEILKEFETLGEGRVRFLGIRSEFREWLSSALDRYAFSVVQESLPEELGGVADYAQGSDACRSQTLDKAKQLTNQCERTSSK